MGVFWKGYVSDRPLEIAANALDRIIRPTAGKQLAPSRALSLRGNARAQSPNLPESKLWETAH